MQYLSNQQIRDAARNYRDLAQAGFETDFRAALAESLDQTRRDSATDGLDAAASEVARLLVLDLATMETIAGQEVLVRHRGRTSDLLAEYGARARQ